MAHHICPGVVANRKSILEKYIGVSGLGQVLLTSLFPPVILSCWPSLELLPGTWLLLHLPSLEASSVICTHENLLAYESVGNRGYLVKAEKEEFDFSSSWTVFILSAGFMG